MRRSVAANVSPEVRARSGAASHANAGGTSSGAQSYGLAQPPPQSAQPFAPIAGPEPQSHQHHHQQQHAFAADLAARQSSIGSFFLSLRQAVRLSPVAVALRLDTNPYVIAALEAGRVDLLPPWPEAARVVVGYGALAGLDARPVLTLMGETLALIADGPPASEPVAAPASAPPVRAAPGPRHGHGHASMEHLLRAGTVLANGARRLPKDAMERMRARPERAFYAMSLPLGLLLLAMNTSAVSTVVGPVAQAFRPFTQYLQVQFAPVHDGLRWIEVDDPRTRRADKLPSGRPLE